MVVNHAKLDAAFAWAQSFQQRAPVSSHHERATLELWPWLAPLGLTTALEVCAGEPPYLAARMLWQHGIPCTTLDGLSVCDVPGDVHDLPFDDASFDLVVARHALEHVLVPPLALMEMMRVTRRWLLVIVPWTSDKAINWPDHLYVLPQRGWEHLFRRLGLIIERFEEGEHTEQHARERRLWQDKELRYLLRNEDARPRRTCPRWGSLTND